MVFIFVFLVFIVFRLLISFGSLYIWGCKKDTMDIKFNKNEDHNKLLLSDLRRKQAKVALGGGVKKIEKVF